MGPNEGYIISMLAIGVAFFLSVFVFHKFRKKWYLGCFLQLVAFCILFCAFVAGYLYFSRKIGKSGAMLCIESIEESQNCRFQQRWWVKPDGTFYFEYDKGSYEHNVTPCGNDSYRDKGSFYRLDSVNALKMNINPTFMIYFDLNRKKIVPIWGKDTLKVINADWQLINEYFNPSV